MTSTLRLVKTNIVALEDVRERQCLQAKVDFQPLDLGDHEIEDLISFLRSITSGDSVGGKFIKLQNVPSGLRVEQ